MAEMVSNSNAIVGETVCLIISGITTTSKVEDAGDGGLERLEMARIKMEAALETSNRWQITDVSLLHWRKKLKCAAQECDGAVRRCRQLSQEEDEAAQTVNQSSFPRRIAHATKAFIFSFVGRDNDQCSAAITTAVRRFERLAEGASEFMRFVQLGGTPQPHLFFDPLIGHIFAGKALLYQVVHPGSPSQYFTVRPTRSEERGLEAMLSFMYEDFNVPRNSFVLALRLRLSESTDIIGTAVKCLRLVTPHFKSTADMVIKLITHLPTQDFSYAIQVEGWTHAHKTLTAWFRPDPFCCQGYEHDAAPSCHGSKGNSSTTGADRLRLSSLFPEPVCEVFLQRHISLSEYSNLPRSSIVNGYDATSSLENSTPLKIGILLLPHDTLEVVLKSTSSCMTEVIDGNKQHHMKHVNVYPDQLDEMFLPKAMEYLHHNVEARTYQICWSSNHGSAHLYVEKTSTERFPRAHRARRHGRNIKSSKGIRQALRDQEKRNCKQLVGGFLNLWVVSSSDRYRSLFAYWLKLLGQN